MALRSRITKKITYNLHERGRKHSGKDRSNVDVQGMINKINSPYIQEQIESGTFNGFCGHQIRQLYGMVPPESVEIDGKIILLEPAIRTVYMSATPEGEVTHQQEFYQNQTGEHVLRQYEAKIGGFSTAVNYIIDGMVLRPNVFGGMDYVFSPNFLDNASIGLFDSAEGTEAMPLIKSMLEYEIVAMYDSMEDSNQNADYLRAMSERARKAENELKRLKAQTKRRIEKANQQVIDEYDSALCSQRTAFDQEVERAQRFLTLNVNEPERQKTSHERKAEGIIKGLTGFFGGGR
ncbi:hypothetical protein [Acinetobacter radioresistens]|uniref:hypothetical protein n=1 Tax=Acinetobacter radioresistens TaxID=40216 RepID=UPI002004485A|nr:hypothetical protein [Acinetobacter radioresistens]MCK4090678.1 hypothetical protein [Acinetobacter radioresistens]MCK4108893.1 hypothetical protein [Acinetobacter radioresistens]